MQKDALALLPDALALSTDALALLPGALALLPGALALSADALALLPDALALQGKLFHIQLRTSPVDRGYILKLGIKETAQRLKPYRIRSQHR
ncbi:MAG: hypothetical protein V7L11_12605 [Nostoc sp.]|uniref:hypothetical protein n=1 Tax=Nostoc sp. TaxID=1180 RepID=UPI002FF9A297